MRGLQSGEYSAFHIYKDTLSDRWFSRYRHPREKRNIPSNRASLITYKCAWLKYYRKLIRTVNGGRNRMVPIWPFHIYKDTCFFRTKLHSFAFIFMFLCVLHVSWLNPLRITVTTRAPRPTDLEIGKILAYEKAGLSQRQIVAKIRCFITVF
jgi:hypothetical protein